MQGHGSFTTSRRKGFKGTIKAPRYVVPGHKRLGPIGMPKLYGKIRDQVEKERRKTTTDLWSSRTMGSKSYHVVKSYHDVSLTVHLINDEWELCSKCSQTSHFPGDHTGEVIAQGLKEALESRGLKESESEYTPTNVVKARLDQTQCLPQLQLTIAYVFPGGTLFYSVCF